MKCIEELRWKTFIKHRFKKSIRLLFFFSLQAHCFVPTSRDVQSIHCQTLALQRPEMQCYYCYCAIIRLFRTLRLLALVDFTSTELLGAQTTVYVTNPALHCDATAPAVCTCCARVNSSGRLCFHFD